LVTSHVRPIYAKKHIIDQGDKAGEAHNIYNYMAKYINDDPWAVERSENPYMKANGSQMVLKYMADVHEYGEGIVYENEERQALFDEFWVSQNPGYERNQRVKNLNPVSCLKALDAMILQSEDPESAKQESNYLL
jgi:hypothetical protein